MENNDTTTKELLTDIEQLARKCRIAYSQETTENLEKQNRNDKDYSLLKCEWQAAEASRAYYKNEVVIRDETISKQRDTISRQRRAIRRLRRLLKSKDRLLASQKSLYEEMLNEKEKADNGKDVEKWFEEMLIRTIRNLESANTAAPQP